MLHRAVEHLSVRDERFHTRVTMTKKTSFKRQNGRILNPNIPALWTDSDAILDRVGRNSISELVQ